MADRVHENIIIAHQEWMGFVQPVGLVVAPTVMASAQVVPDRNFTARQREYIDLLEIDRSGSTIRYRAPDVERILLDWLGWTPGDLADATKHSDLERAIPEMGVVLSATWAVPTSGSSESEWMMLIRREEAGSDLDKPPNDEDGWSTSLHSRFERLLRETGIPIGLLCNDRCLRLIYAPPGESSGHITFDFFRPWRHHQEGRYCRLSICSCLNNRYSMESEAKACPTC